MNIRVGGRGEKGRNVGLLAVIYVIQFGTT
jgi:hypothetical protein